MGIRELLIDWAKNEGKLEGKLEGELKKQLEIARELKKEGLSTAFIARTTKLPLAQIKKL